MNMNQNSLGMPGSAPLPNMGQQGTAYNTAQIHPAAQAASATPKTNPVNAGHPAMAPGMVR